MARSSKATLALLIYGIMMHYSAYCTPIGMAFPKMRYVYAFLLNVCATSVILQSKKLQNLIILPRRKNG